MPHALLARSLVFNQLYIHSKSSWARLKQLVPNQNTYLADINSACSLLYLAILKKQPLHNSESILSYDSNISKEKHSDTGKFVSLTLSSIYGPVTLLLPLGTHCSFYSSSSHLKHSVYLHFFHAAFIVSLSSSFVWEQQPSPHSLSTPYAA